MILLILKLEFHLFNSFPPFDICDVTATFTKGCLIIDHNPISFLLVYCGKIYIL